MIQKRKRKVLLALLLGLPSLAPLAAKTQSKGEEAAKSRENTASQDKKAVKAAPEPQKQPDEKVSKKEEGATKNYESEIRRIQELITSRKDTFCANFTQYLYKDIRKESLKKDGDILYSVKREGSFLFQRPSKFRFSFSKPADSELLYDGKMVYSIQIQDDGKKTAISYSLDSARGQETKRLVDLVLNFGKLHEEYKVIAFEEDANKANFTLEPQNRAEIAKVELSVELKEGYISYLKIFYPRTENSSTFLFKKTAQVVNDSSFALPKDTVVEALGI